MHAQTLSAGVRLAGRYRIEDLVGETPRSQTWRAVDHVLNRSVSVQVVPSSDHTAEPFLTAARRATAVEDPRFLRVLDASHEEGFAYVVREWASGVSLDNVLRQGPLSAPRAAEVMREVAEAVAAAHRADVQHRRLDPARIIIKHNGAVRMLGLATDQALHAPDEDTEATSVAGEQADVKALGRLLYACLVARWPGSRDLGLPAAPTEHGRLLRPRQVRAGVDPAIDAVCDRILGNGTRQGPHLRTAQQVARELAVLALGDDLTTTFSVDDEDDETVPRGVIPLAPDPSGPPPAVNLVPPPRALAESGPQQPDPPVDRRQTGGRAPVWLAVLLLIALAGAVTYLILDSSGGGDPTSSPEAGGADTSPPTRELDIESVADFDPQGTDGGENPETAGFAIDGDASTTWTTSSYFGSAELGNLKDGVGLLLDLGKAQDVSSVTLRLDGGPTSVQVYAAPEDAGRPSTVDDLELLGEARDAGADLTLRPPEPLTTRRIVVWLTELPPVGGDTFKGAIAEISVRG